MLSPCSGVLRSFATFRSCINHLVMAPSDLPFVQSGTGSFNVLPSFFRHSPLLLNVMDTVCGSPFFLFIYLYVLRFYPLPIVLVRAMIHDFTHTVYFATMRLLGPSAWPVVWYPTKTSFVFTRRFQLWSTVRGTITVEASDGLRSCPRFGDEIGYQQYSAWYGGPWVDCLMEALAWAASCEGRGALFGF